MEKDTSLTVEEVAEILKIAKNTVYELIKRGELSSYRVGRKVRIDMSDIEQYINKGKKNNPSNKDSASTISNTPIPNHPTGFEQEKVNIGPSNNFVICGQDVLLDILSRYLQRHAKGTQALRSYVGSYNGLIELYHDRAQLATAHLWDGDTSEYNTPYVRRLLPGIPCLIINLAYRMQGFYVQKGNPKRIQHWEDLITKNLRIINREKGSGTRVLLDEKLRVLKVQGNQIEGYYKEEFSHLSVASAVARGEADAGLGNEKAALQVQGIDFVPMQKERYDLIMLKEKFNNPVNQSIFQILNSREFKSELQGLGGYDISETGTILAET